MWRDRNIYWAIYPSWTEVETHCRLMLRKMVCSSWNKLVQVLLRTWIFFGSVSKFLQLSEHTWKFKTLITSDKVLNHQWSIFCFSTMGRNIFYSKKWCSHSRTVDNHIIWRITWFQCCFPTQFLSPVLTAWHINLLYLPLQWLHDHCSY